MVDFRTVWCYNMLCKHHLVLQICVVMLKGDIKMKYIAYCKLKNFTTSNLQILFDFINLIEFYSDDYGDLIFIESILE